MKKKICILLIFSICLISLTGCFNNQPANKLMPWYDDSASVRISHKSDKQVYIIESIELKREIYEKFKNIKLEKKPVPKEVFGAVIDQGEPIYYIHFYPTQNDNKMRIIHFL